MLRNTPIEQGAGHMGQDQGSTEAQTLGFNAYDALDVSLGDLMRGERATLGKSLLDVERELKIKASLIAAIENGDLGAFSSQGFIAGYVRSYARYLGMEPEWTFQRFSEETGFIGAHGLAPGKSVKRQHEEAPRRVHPNDVMLASRVTFSPARQTLMSRIEPGALGSVAVLLVLVLGIGYGAWSILYDIQRLQIAPVDEAPVSLVQLDPLMGASQGAFDTTESFDIALPATETMDRIYRPQALEAPVMTPRNQALATLDPDEVGTFGSGPSGLTEQVADADDAPPAVQVTARVADEVMVFAVRPSWIRISAADGTTLFEGTLNAGESYAVANAAEPPTLRSGNAGSIFFAVNGVTYGPAGAGASIASNVALSADAVSATYAMADATTDPDLPEVAELILGAGPAPTE